MESYLMMLFVTLEQEKAMHQLFLENGWQYSKPDLSIMTSSLGPMKCPAQFPRLDTPSMHQIGLSDNRMANIAHHSSEQIVVIDPYTTADIHGQDQYHVVGNIETDEGLKNDHDYLMRLSTGSPSKTRQKETDTSSITKSTKDINIEIMLAGETGVRKSTRKRKYGQGMKDVSFSDDSLNEKENTDKTQAVDENTHETNNESNDISTNVGRKVRVIDKDLVEPVREIDTSADISYSDRTTLCTVCGKNVSTRNIKRHLKSHQNFHHKCGACSLYFQTQEEKDNHNKTKHDGLQFVCSVCGVRYKFLNSLKEHMTLKHEFYKPQFSCSICGKGFSRIGQREDHMNTHKASNPYVCTVCGRSYNNKSAYNRHTQACQSNRKYTCSECGHVYKSKLGLNNHEKHVHANFDCICKCGKVFRSKCDEEKHQTLCSVKSNSEIDSTAGNSDSIAVYSESVTEGVADSSKCAPDSMRDTSDSVAFSIADNSSDVVEPCNESEDKELCHDDLVKVEDGMPDNLDLPVLEQLSEHGIIGEGEVIHVRVLTEGDEYHYPFP